MWSTNFENISSGKNRFGLGLDLHFWQQNKHILTKKMLKWTMCKVVHCFSNIAHVKCSMVTSHLHLHLLLLSWLNLYRHHTNQLMHKVRRLYIKAWNYIKNDFDQETGQEYSIIVQIIVTLSKFPSHTRRKNTLNSQSAFCTHSAVYILCLVYILYLVCTLHFIQTSISGSLFLVTVICTTHTIDYKIPVCELIQHFRSFLH